MDSQRADKTVSERLSTSAQPNAAVANSPMRARRGKRVRISERQRLLIWDYLDEKYGRICYAEGCGRTDVQIDHKDGDRNHTRLGNLQPACPVHQKIRTVARSIVSVRLDANVRGEVPGEHANEAIAINRLKEPMWLDFMRGELTWGPMEKQRIRGMSAKHCNISPSTVDRYITKHCNPLGEFRIVHDVKQGIEFLELRRAPEK